MGDKTVWSSLVIPTMKPNGHRLLSDFKYSQETRHCTHLPHITNFGFTLPNGLLVGVFVVRPWQCLCSSGLVLQMWLVPQSHLVPSRDKWVHHAIASKMPTLINLKICYDPVNIFCYGHTGTYIWDYIIEEIWLI